MASRRLSELFAEARTRPSAADRATIRELAAAAQISYHSAARRVRSITDSRLKDIPPPVQPQAQPQPKNPGEEKEQTHVPRAQETFEDALLAAVNTPNPDADDYSWSSR